MYASFQYIIVSKPNYDLFKGQQGVNEVYKIKTNWVWNSIFTQAMKKTYYAVNVFYLVVNEHQKLQFYNIHTKTRFT